MTADTGSTVDDLDDLSEVCRSFPNGCALSGNRVVALSDPIVIAR